MKPTVSYGRISHLKSQIILYVRYRDNDRT